MNVYKLQDSSAIISTSQVIETLNYVKKFCGSTILIKLGGAPLNNLALVRNLCQDLALVRAAGISMVIVHGGGVSISNALAEKGIKSEFIDGIRVTTRAMVDVVETILCGKINKSVVRTLNSAGVSAVGLAGSDANTLQCKRIWPKLGEVGKIEHVNTELIVNYLNSQKESGVGFIPVIAPLGVSREGDALNVNADLAASKIASALGIKKLIYMTDQDGILNSEGKVISQLDAKDLVTKIDDGVVKGGMLVKAQTILDALNDGVLAVHIINGSRPHALIEELYTNRGIGTVCKLGD